MILRFSALVRRHAGGVLLTALAIAVAVVAAAIRARSEPTAALAGFAVAAFLALMTGAVVATVFRGRAQPRFEVDEAAPAFRTPRSAASVFLVLFLIAAVALLAVAGGWPWAHGDRDPAWLVLMVLVGGPTLAFSVAVWRGHGTTLTPDGIRADLGHGTLTIPWAALSPDQPSPADNQLDLVLSDPAAVTRTGLVRRRNRIGFEGTPPAFVAAAIRHYATHPADRLTIGTPAGHRRLADPPAVPPEPGTPPPSRGRIILFVVLGVLAFGGGAAAEDWVDLLIGRHSILGHVAYGGQQLVMLGGFGLLVEAVRGIRARRRPYTPPPPPQPPPSPPDATGIRPPWARDVTNIP